jgi:preprotein translocase subunit SecF
MCGKYAEVLRKMDFKGGTRLIFTLSKEQPIEYVRAKLDSIEGPDGRPLYPDAEVTSILIRSSNESASRALLGSASAALAPGMRASAKTSAAVSGVQARLMRDASEGG